MIFESKKKKAGAIGTAAGGIASSAKDLPGGAFMGKHPAKAIFAAKNIKGKKELEGNYTQAVMDEEKRRRKYP